MKQHLHAGTKYVLSLSLALALFGSLLPPPAMAQTLSKHTAAGYALIAHGNIQVARRRALENALWLALEQAVKTLIAPRNRGDFSTEIRTILAQPRAFIRTYAVLSEGPTHGRYVVVVRASVDRSRLTKRLAALKVPIQRTAGENLPSLHDAPEALASPSIDNAAAPRDPTSSSRDASSQSAQIAQATGSPPASRAKMRIAILPLQLGFTNPQWAQSWDVSLGVTELIEEALFKTGQFRIVERRQLEQVLKEQGYGQGGTLDPKTAAKVGRVLGIEAFVTGTVNQLDISGLGGLVLPGFAVGLYRAQVGLTARIVDTSTAEITSIVRASGQSEGTLVLAQLQQLTFGGAEFRTTVLGRALDQAVQDLTAKLVSGLAR